MQERRRTDLDKQFGPDVSKISVPTLYWEELEKKDLDKVCQIAIAKPYRNKGLILPFINQTFLVDLEERCIKQVGEAGWIRMRNPLFELICLVYLLNVCETNISNELVTAQELKESHFFQGPHAIDLDPLLKRFGYDLEGFKRSAESLDGKSLEMADAAYRVISFPKVPVSFLLWEGDDEFEPRISIIFDRSIEKHLSADAIWGLVKLVSAALLGRFPNERKSGNNQLH